MLNNIESIISERDGEYDTCTADGKRLYKKEFRTVDEFMDKVKANGWYHAERNSSWIFGDYKGKDLKDSRRILEDVLRMGDAKDKIMERVENMRTEFTVEYPEIFSNTGFSMKRKRRIREDGDELNLDRVMAGVPECWERVERNTKQKAITLGINGSMAGFNGTDTFAQLCALAILTSDVLSKRGVATRVMYVCSSYNIFSNNDEVAFSFPLKEFDEPLDIKRIGTYYAQGIFRDYGFGIREFGFENKRLRSYGSSPPSSQNMIEFLGLDYLLECKCGNDSFGNVVQNFITSIMEELSNLQ